MIWFMALAIRITHELLESHPAHESCDSGTNQSDAGRPTVSSLFHSLSSPLHLFTCSLFLLSIDKTEWATLLFSFSLNFIVLPLHIDGPSVCWINNCILHLLICAAAVASCRICATTATVFLGGYTAWICAAATTVFLALRPLWFGCLFVLKLTCHLVSYLTSKC